MKKWICTICGYVHEGDTPPDACPQCNAPAEKFEEQGGGEEMAWADEHRIGVAKDVDPDILAGLRANFTGECTEVGMYLAMSRQAEREGLPEVAEAYKRIAFEEAEHAARFAELLGEVLLADTRENLKARVAAEQGACTVSGVEMFIAQAARQFELWTGEPAPIDVMRRALTDHLED